MPTTHKCNQKLEAVLEMYKHAEQRRGLQISRIWETMKLTTTIVFGLFTATIAILGFFPREHKSCIVAFLPILATLIVMWSWLNVRRQYGRFLEIVTWICKIERYLGLHKSIKEEEKRYFADDNHLIPERFLKSEKFKTGKDFIETELRWCSDTMYGHFAKLYVIYIALAIVLTMLTIYYYVVG